MRRAMTLIELLVALTITATVVGGLSSAIMIASRAAPQSGDPLKARLDTLHGLDLLAAELAGAVEITEAEARSIAFIVRRHDGGLRTVRYQWSGVAGDPLLRTVGSGEDVEVLPGVRRLTIGYERQQGPIAPRRRALDATRISIIDGVEDDSFRVDNAAVIAQPFDPEFPEGTTSAVFTEAQLRLRRNELLLPSGTVTVQIRRFNTETGAPGELLAWGETSVSGISTSLQIVRVDLTSRQAVIDGGPLCIMVVCNNSPGVTAAIDRASGSGDWRVWYRQHPTLSWEQWSNSRRLVHSVRAIPTTNTDPDPAPIRRVTIEIDNGSRPVRVGAFIKPTPGGSP